MVIEELDLDPLKAVDDDVDLVDALFSSVQSLPNAFLMESASNNLSYSGRFSFIGADPFLTFESKGRQLRKTSGNKVEESEGNPFVELRAVLVEFGEASHPVYPFCGGAVGYMGYESAELIETLRARKEDCFSIPDMRFCFYDVVVIYDHQEDKAHLSSTGFPESGINRTKRAKERFNYFKEILSKKAEMEEVEPVVGELSSNFSRSNYFEAVGKIKDYISEGDIYQANLSQRFSAIFKGSDYLLYGKFKKANPVSFGAYLRYDDFSVISNSPERFLSLRDGRLETRPIKGTIKRVSDGVKDAALMEQLKNSAKDCAEHVMIVDLERNDLGRVCRYGSVKVDNLKIIESYSNLHHMVSTVSGQLREGMDAVDCITAAFPGGSITGAPKVRAMEIIHEVEPDPRWIYTGSIGYIGFDGSMDLNIAIRTALVKDEKIYFSVGGGIVADSDPQSEYEETLLKGEVFRNLSRHKE
ncbi:MAG: aminodeoxychorismate synthase component I [Proteobacteria bacterium]|nr:aminodeoxychorismate synthase component I [Pseudomonadota bacterium]